MERNKNFEAYATSLFGEDYHDKKGKKGKAAPWLEGQDYHPKPFDVVVVDKNENVIKGKENDKPHKTGIGKRVSVKKNSPSQDGRLTPVIIDMTDSPIDDDKTRGVFNKRRKGDHKDGFNKDKKNKFIFEQLRSEGDDSGISLTEESDDIANVFREHLATRHEDSGNESDLAFFCVDHMKMCSSKNEFRKHRHCNIDVKSGASTPSTSRTSAAREKNRTTHATFMEGRRPSSISLSSRGSNTGRSSAAFVGMQTMYLETLEKLYKYSGVIIEDRQSLKKELRDKKVMIEEEMMEYMEELIANILKLKTYFLADLDIRHKSGLLQISQQVAKIHKLRFETQALWDKLQVPSDFKDFEGYKGIIVDAKEKVVVLELILQDIFASCKQFKYELQPAPEIDDFFETDSIAHVEEIKVTPLLPPFLCVKAADDDDDESVSDFTSLKSIEGFENVCGKHESANETCCFTGCAYITDDSVLLVDWSNGSIKMLNKQGLVADYMKFEKSPWDVVRNFSGQVAVTVPQLQKVFTIEAEPHLRIVGEFSTRCDCFGICKIGDNYAVTCDPWSKTPSLRVFDKFGHILLKVQTDSLGNNYFRCPLHVCSDFFNTVMYVSDATADCVYAISVSGSIIFCYKHESLEYPTGVETDRNNCLHVCGKVSSNIHKLTNKGELQEKLLQNNHDVQNPCAIAFHPNGDHMILTDLKGDMASGYWKLHFM